MSRKRTTEAVKATEEALLTPKQRKQQAAILVSPSVNAALTAEQFLPRGSATNFSDIVFELRDQIDCVLGGKLDRGEAMLVTQAHALDAIFNRLAQKASRMGLINQYEMYMKLALKAQNQARMTWESLAAIKNPPQVAHVHQTNIAAGPQQVNNGVPAPASENKTEPSKLLEETHGERLDPLTPGTTGRANSDLEAVESLHWAQDG